MKKVQDLSDRELQEGIFKYLRDISNSSYYIKTGESQTGGNDRTS